MSVLPQTLPFQAQPQRPHQQAHWQSTAPLQVLQPVLHASRQPVRACQASPRPVHASRVPVSHLQRDVHERTVPQAALHLEAQRRKGAAVRDRNKRDDDECRGGREPVPSHDRRPEQNARRTDGSV